ncbi:MAG: methyltransferase domain-containing protein [Bryobacteraceae bacterium]|jgi:protein-L-isoaspartate(D-aspartate) O-methyltransferase
MTFDDYRRCYAEEIEYVANMRSPALVAAFARVPREKFLGRGPWQIASGDARAMAAMGVAALAYRQVTDPRHLYHNVVVALDTARDINNGQPSALATWIGALDLKSGDRVYHMGCGVGYYTAIMAEVVGTGGSVVAIDAEPDLAARARENLSGHPQVSVAAADGAAFDPGMCDAMLINAGVTHPHALWLDRLREGGRLVVPITIAATPKIGQGVMARIVRQSSDFTAGIASVVAIYSAASLRDPELELPLRKAFTTGALLKMKSLRRDTHDADEACLYHTPGMCLSSAG